MNQIHQDVQSLASQSGRSRVALGIESVTVHQGPSTKELVLMGLLSQAILPSNPNKKRKGDVFQEALLSSFIENAGPNFIFLYDHPSCDFISCGEGLAEFFGFTQDEILARSGGWLSIIHPDDLDRVVEHARLQMSQSASSVSVQMRVRRKDGRLEWIKNDWRVHSFDEHGQPMRVIGLIQVITKLALANQAMANEAALASLHRTLAEEWVEGIFLVDASWSILYVSQQAQICSGYSAEELMQRPFDQLFETKLRPPHSRSKGKTTQRVRMLHKDGSVCSMEVSFRAFGKQRMLVTTRDMTEQIESERRANNQASYYKALFENTPCGIATFDSNFALVNVNQTLKKMLGYADHQMAQRPLSDLMAADSCTQVDGWREMAAKKEKFSVETEVTLKRRDGRALTAHAVVTIMPDGVVGDTYGIVILMDITARKEAQVELAKQHHFNEKLVRESAAMIGLVDRDARVIMVNPAVERVSEFSAADLVGKSLWDCGLLDKDELPSAKLRMQEILNGAERVAAVAKTRTKSGELRHLQIQNTATRDANGNVENIIITAVDITEQQRLQQHLMEAVEQEQARIGHDLHDGVGQLLTGIGAMVECLQGELTGRQHDDAGRIFELVRETIKQVRQLSRTMSPTAVQHRDLSASLLLLSDTVRTSFRRHCVAHLEPDLHITDSTLAGHLFRIAQECVNNAIRHGAPKEVSISLRRDGADHGILEILNDGEAFDCRPGSPVEGIGLRVMKHRASLIHAQLEVRCPESGGVRITCRFPLPALSKKSPPMKTKTTKTKLKLKP